MKEKNKMGRSRIEEILENILGENDPIATPVSRNEALLIQIYEMLQNTDLVASHDGNGTVRLTIE